MARAGIRPSAARRSSGGAQAAPKPRRRARDSDATRATIAQAALREFTEKGYEGTTVSTIARRAGVSKQLLCHHYPKKEDLFHAVHDLRFRDRPGADAVPSEPADLMAERFLARAQDIDYVRFLTWEAASGRDDQLPGRDARLNRIIGKAGAIRGLQREGRLPKDLDPRLMQLAITSLATYPLAFRQVTRLVTGRDPADAGFQRDWHRFLQALGQRLFGGDNQPSAQTAVPIECSGRDRLRQR